MTQEALKYLKAITEAFGPDAGIELDQKAWAKLHTAIKEALAQTQEPLTENGMYRLGYHNGYGFGEAYGKANPPQRTWVGLTDEEICTFSMWLDDKSDVAVFTAIEAKLKEKNA